MSGNIILTTVGRDEIANYFAGTVNGKIYKFRLGEGGFLKSSLVTETIDSGATGTQKEYTYEITGGDFDIIGVDTGADEFTVAGDQTELFVVGAQVVVIGSTGNDGTYTVASATFGGVNTDIVMNEDVTDPTIDGQIYIDHLPILKGPAIDDYHHPLKVIEYNGVIPVQTIEDTTGTGILTGDGTGTVNYKTGDLEVDFDVNVGVGHTVVVEYKYANVPKQPDEALTQLVSQGDSSLFTFERDFVPADLVFRGIGWGTLRCRMYLAESEGIDDGTLYGGTPYYFEGGIFDEDDVMLCYFTFDKERKRGSTTMLHTVDFIV